MHARFTIIAPALTCLMLVTTASACSSSPGSSETASGWRNFVVASGVNPSKGPTGLIKRVDDMERIGGFRFIFPSYLPEGMGKKITLDASVQASGDPGAQEWVRIAPESEDSLAIFIREVSCNPPCVDWQQIGLDTGGQRIGNTDISCSVPFSDLLELECQWMDGGKWFIAIFEWTVDHLASGHVTEEMRQEAVKVVESMILAPERP